MIETDRVIRVPYGASKHEQITNRVMPDLKRQKEAIMAKRYTTYEQLPLGYYKPEGTLGRHHATVVLQNEAVAVIGSVSGSVILRPGDTLGYNCGEVWKVPSPTSYRDPLRRFLAERKISQRVVEFVAADFVLETDERWYDNGHCPNGRPTNRWVTDGKRGFVSRVDLEEAHGYFQGGGRDSVRIEGGTYALEVRDDRYMNGCSCRRVDRILLRPGYDAKVVISAIKAELGD